MDNGHPCGTSVPPSAKTKGTAPGALAASPLEAGEICVR